MDNNTDVKINDREILIKKLYRKFMGDLLVLLGSIGIAFTIIAGKFMQVLELEFSTTEEIDLATGFISKLRAGKPYGFGYLIGVEPFNIVLLFFFVLIIIGLACYVKSKEKE